MLSILLVYYVGKGFYQLADLHRKNKWAFGILGVVVFYIGMIIGVIGIGLYGEMAGSFDIASMSDFVLTLLSIPVGLLITWGFYKFLKNKWSYPSGLDTPIDDFDLE